MGKRTKAALKTAGKNARITGKQRAARKVNIEVARRAKKSGTKGSSKGAGSKGDLKKLSPAEKGKRTKFANAFNAIQKRTGSGMSMVGDGKGGYSVVQN